MCHITYCVIDTLKVYIEFVSKDVVMSIFSSSVLKCKDCDIHLSGKEKNKQAFVMLDVVKYICNCYSFD